MSIDAEVLQIFREEAYERLDRMVDGLLAIESGQSQPALIDALFRDAHSIKGNASLVGFDDVRTISHAIEDLLDDARTEGAMARGLVDPLLTATDALRRGIDGETGLVEEAMQVLSPDHAQVEHTDVSTATAAAVAVPAERPSPSGNGSIANGGREDPRASGGERRSMRVASDTVDRLLDTVGETVLHRRRLEHLLTRDPADEAGVEEELGRGEVMLDDLQDSVIRLRTLPLSSITGGFPRAVRDLAVAEGKEVELSIRGTETQLDRVILDGTADTVMHLLRNAVSHGIELPDERERASKPRRGRLELSAEQRGGMVAIRVLDDGRGVSAELLGQAREQGSLTDVLAAPGFSTATVVSDISGRGVGLDAVKSHVESLGGSVEVTSEPEVGTSVLVLLPLTLALLRVMLVERGGQAYAIPLAAVQEAMIVKESMSLGGQTSLELRGSSVPVADLAELIGAAEPSLPENPPGLIVASSQQRAAVVCDALLGEQEVVIKHLGLLAGVAGYLGAAILGDGRIALVLDPAFLARTSARAARASPHTRASSAIEAAPAQPDTARVLVVDDQFTVRELQRSILETAGYDVATARDGREALEVVNRDPGVALVVTDIQMPGMDGFALLEAIRRDERHRSLPVVVVTSLGSEEHRNRGAELGADAYIVKEGFDQQALLETIRRLVGS